MADPCPCDQLLNIFCLDFRTAVDSMWTEGPTCGLIGMLVEFQPIFSAIADAIPPTQQLGFCDKQLRGRAGQWAGLGKNIEEAFEVGAGATIKTTAQFGTPIVNCPATPPGKKMWGIQISWDVFSQDLEAVVTIVNNCCLGGDGMAVDEEARACCADSQTKIRDLEERVALLELQMEGAQILATEQAGRITRLQLFLEPVGKFGSQGDHFDLWLRDRAVNDTAVQVALLVGMEIALREGGVATRQIFISVIVDALGKWLFDVIKAAITSMPNSVAVDPEGDTPLGPSPRFITILDFVGSKSAQIGLADDAQASLDGGSSKETGGSAAYGPSVASTGQGIGGLLAGFGTGLADGLARGLKKGDIPLIGIEIPPEDEEDPFWGKDKKRNFALSDLLQVFLPEEVQAAESSSLSTPAQGNIIVSRDNRGIVKVSNIPAGSQPFKITKEGGLITATDIGDPGASPIRKVVLADGSIQYTNIVPGSEPFITYVDEFGVFHATNLEPGFQPFDITTLPDGTLLYSNVDVADIPFIVETLPDGTVRITQR